VGGLVTTIDTFFQESDLNRLLTEAADLASHLDDLVVRNSDTISSSLTNLEGILADNRERLGRILNNVEITSQELVTLTQSLNAAVGDGSTIRSALEDLASLMNAAEEEVPPTLEDLRSGVDTLERILSEREEDIQQTLINVEALSQNLVAASEDVAELTDYVNSGRGNLGALLRDDELYDDLRELIRELKRRPWRLLWRE
jgi:phospholipid/cholesterol/gamma-HCH transport system substrate-binding protein